MMTPENDVPSFEALAEQLPPQEASIEQIQTHLGQLLSMSPEAVPAQRLVLQEITQKVIAATSDPTSKEVARQLSAIYEWQLLGQAGGQLPEALVHSGWEDYETSVPVIRYNSFLQFHAGNEVSKTYSRFGLDEIVKSLRQDVASRELAVRADIGALIRACPTYQFITAFEAKAPVEYARVEQPLPPLLRAFRERIIENEVIVSLRLPSDEQLARGDPDVKGIFRAQRRVDDETIYLPQPQPPATELCSESAPILAKPLPKAWRAPALFLPV